MDIIYKITHFHHKGKVVIVTPVIRVVLHANNIINVHNVKMVIFFQAINVFIMEIIKTIVHKVAILVLAH